MKHSTNRIGTIILLTIVLISCMSLFLHVFGGVSVALQLIAGMLPIVIFLLILIFVPIVLYRLNTYKRKEVMGKFRRR